MKHTAWEAKVRYHANVSCDSVRPFLWQISGAKKIGRLEQNQSQNVEQHWTGCFGRSTGGVVVWLCGDRKQQKSSSPPSHVEIKLSGSGEKFIFRIKDSSKKEPRRLGPHPQLLGPLPFCISINSFLSFSRCYIFKPSSASNLPFSGFLLHQCHDPILKESWTRPDAG